MASLLPWFTWRLARGKQFVSYRRAEHAGVTRDMAHDIATHDQGDDVGIARHPRERNREASLQNEGVRANDEHSLATWRRTLAAFPMMHRPNARNS